MSVTDLIREQSFECMVMAGAGVFVMAMYQLFGITVQLFRPGRRTATVLEPVFWAVAAVAVSYFLYYCAYGRLSFHAVLAFTAGALLWKKIFCGIIDKIYMKLHIRQGIQNKDGEKETKQPVQGHQSGDRY